jgi:hypothetical protein
VGKSACLLRNPKVVAIVVAEDHMDRFSESLAKLYDNERRAQITTEDECIGIRYLAEDDGEMITPVMNIRDNGELHFVRSRRPIVIDPLVSVTRSILLSRRTSI